MGFDQHGCGGLIDGSDLSGVRFTLRPTPVIIPFWWVIGCSMCSERIPQIFFP